MLLSSSVFQPTWVPTVQMYTGVVRVHLSRLHVIDLSEIVNFSCTLLCFAYCNTLLEAIFKIGGEHNYQNLLWFHAQYTMTHVHVSTSSYSRSRARDSRNTKSGRIRVQSAGSGLHGVWVSLSPHLQRPQPHLHSPVCCGLPVSQRNSAAWQQMHITKYVQP